MNALWRPRPRRPLVRPSRLRPFWGGTFLDKPDSAKRYSVVQESDKQYFANKLGNC